MSSACECNEGDENGLEEGARRTGTLSDGNPVIGVADDPDVRPPAPNTWAKSGLRCFDFLTVAVLQ